MEVLLLYMEAIMRRLGTRQSGPSAEDTARRHDVLERSREGLEGSWWGGEIANENSSEIVFMCVRVNVVVGGNVT